MKYKDRTYWEYGYTYFIRDYRGQASRVIGVINREYNKDGEFFLGREVLIKEHPSLKGLKGTIKTLRLPHQCPKNNNDIIELDCNGHGTHYVSLCQVTKLP